jgi:hypothetical protein
MDKWRESMIITEETKAKMTREQWILANQMSSAVMTLNSIFCDGEDDKLDMIAQGIAEICPGMMPLEDAIVILEKALIMKKIKINEEKENAEEVNK